MSREGVGGCSGAHRVHNSNVLPDTLLGPEATPRVVVTVVVMVVLSLHLGGGVWCLVIG